MAINTEVSITDMKSLNKEKGFYFFSPSTMKFFNSKIESGGKIFGDWAYFVTSEKSPDGERRYSLRKINLTTGDVDTVGEFEAFDNKRDAMNARKVGLDPDNDWYAQVHKIPRTKRLSVRR